jgi:hypothetical protein
MTERMHGWTKKQKPQRNRLVSVKEANKIRFGKLDSSLDATFGTKSVSICWTNQVGYLKGIK